MDTSAPQASRLIIAKKQAEVKQVSQAVDANGAPLVVKHGADADTEKLQSLVAQQRMTLADVSYLNLEAIESLLESNKNVKHFFPQATAEYALFQAQRQAAENNARMVFTM